MAKKKSRAGFLRPLAVKLSESYCTFTWVMRVAQLPSEPRVLPQVKFVAT